MSTREFQGTVASFTPLRWRRRFGARNARGPMPQSNPTLAHMDGKLMKHRFTGQVRRVCAPIRAAALDDFEFVSVSGHRRNGRPMVRSLSHAAAWLRNADEVKS